MKKFFVCLFLIAIATSMRAQTFTRYIVRFKNKATNPFSLTNPTQYLSQRAIDRRTRYSIAIDSTDLPVTPRYVDSVRLAGAVTILNVSKWLNQVSIQTSDAAALNKISSFPFVQSASPIAAKTLGSGKPGKQSIISLNHKKKAIPKRTADFFNYGASFNQIHLHNGEFLHNIGLRGQTMQIGMLDAGFFHYTTLKAFDSVNANGQVLGIYDFVARDNSVIEDDTHGMECFSVIAANIPGQFVGTAPKASFYLFRSEDSNSEYPIEEHNWVCGAEKIDSAGGDVISSSLGYNTFDNSIFDHTYADMNGNTTMCAIGADLAAKKGILVLNSAGNEGGNSWGKIVTPADGDSVIAVGAVNNSGVPAGFTSRGPSSDGQVKPDVSSMGVNTIVQAPNNVVSPNNGTSFSCPNMAGLATCLWQGFPEYNNIRIIKALQQAGDRFTSPNDTTGYGIPDMRKAVMNLLKDFATTSATPQSNCKAIVQWTSKDISTMKYELERKIGTGAFVKIKDVSTLRSTFGINSLSYTDSLINVALGTQVSYRIRQILDTAAASFFADYIDTVTLTSTASCITTAVQPVNMVGDEFVLMPNPVKNLAHLRITTSYPVTQLIFRIVSSNGQSVYFKQSSKTTGTADFDFPVHQLAKGKYYLMVNNAEKKLTALEFMKL